MIAASRSRFGGDEHAGLDRLGQEGRRLVGAHQRLVSSLVERPSAWLVLRVVGDEIGLIEAGEPRQGGGAERRRRRIRPRSCSPARGALAKATSSSSRVGRRPNSPRIASFSALRKALADFNVLTPTASSPISHSLGQRPSRSTSA